MIFFVSKKNININYYTIFHNKLLTFYIGKEVVMEKMILNIFSFLIVFLKKALSIIVIILVFSLLVHLMDNPANYPFFMKFYTLEEKIFHSALQAIKMTFPHEFYGVDITKEILILVVIVSYILLSTFNRKIQQAIVRVKEKNDYYEWRKKIEKNASKEMINKLDEKFKEIHSSKKDRKELLKEFANLKTQLDSFGQMLTFLSIDIVDSSGMKKGEDPHLAMYSFDRYNEIVMQTLNANNVIKYVATPDGIMSCFKSVDSAVTAAQELFDKLENFNSTENKIQDAFQIRCGINSGFVYIDQSAPLEQVSDRNIDIAGHMQKHAKANTINISASALQSLKKRDGFIKTNNVIDEQVVYEWTK